MSLRQSVDDLLSFYDGELSLVQLRKDELSNQLEGLEILSGNEKLVSNLQNIINMRVEDGHKRTIIAVDNSHQSSQRGKILLLGITGVSLVIAGLVVWLYVGRNLVFRVTRLDESMRTIASGDLSTTVVTDGNDEIAAMAHSLQTFRDTLSETQSELVQAGKLATLGHLSAGIAHELNQPLSAIRSYTHNAKRYLEKNDSVGALESLERHNNLIERMSFIINHLRTLARKPTVQIETVEICTIIEDTIRLMEPMIREHDIALDQSFYSKIVFVQAEATQLGQILINLISNAIDALKESSTKHLSIVLEENNENIILTVKDTGQGITTDDLPHIFEPFFSTKAVGTGLGLGLSISYSIIKNFGGSIKVKSKENSNTTFTVTLKKASQE
ncbi:MAG: GHKL domain-containing protein [SAR324 cluster bacterium]|nr:GHKL domain-containing protein [SAR324 cluster bacterium]